MEDILRNILRAMNDLKYEIDCFNEDQSQGIYIKDFDKYTKEIEVGINNLFNKQGEK